MKWIVLDGRPYLWRDVLKLRKKQREEERKLKQLTLFELKEDSRPTSQKKAAGRYKEPLLFD